VPPHSSGKDGKDATKTSLFAASQEAKQEKIMPKMKSNRAAKKRFHLTGTGRVRRSKAGGNHCLNGKSRKQRRRLRANDMVAKCMEKRIKLMLPYG
jgi:large subunit ribosomal protein L35